MHVKKGDKVIVTTGKDKGRQGPVIKAFPKIDMILVEHVNMKKKHLRPKQEGKKGQVVEQAAPIHVSNVKKI
jgi:large subunit ribosomal protein L24